MVAIYDPNTQQWTNRTEPFRKQQDTSLLGVGTATTAAFASGFIPWKQGRLWDKYVGALRAAEEYSPAGVLRTFHLSNFFSQFQSIPGGSLHVGPQQLRDNPAYADYLRRLIGESGQKSTGGRLIREGVTLKGGRLFWGESQDVALKYATALRTPNDLSGRLGAGLAAHLGFTPIGSTGNTVSPHIFFGKTQPFGELSKAVNPVMEGMPAQIIGGKSAAQFGYRQGIMWGTEFVDRFNRLLRSPFEMEPLKTVFTKAQEKTADITGRVFGKRWHPQFAVPEGPALKTLGRLSLKYGIGLGALAIGYQTVDHMFRNSSLFDETIFSEGLTYAAATVGVKANILASQFSEFTGLSKYREAQEEIAPGSTSLQKLLAFPIIGAAGASFAAYGATVRHMAKLQLREGLDAATARRVTTEKLKTFGGEGFLASIGRELGKKEGLYSRQDIAGKIIRKIATPEKGGELSYKFIGKLGPAKLAGLMGAGLGLGLVLPFIPGALVPSTGSEELKRIYSGEQEVGIRKGRLWEFGRSSYEGGRIDRYVPHWYARMKMRATERGIWGDEEPNPISKWWRKEFTYDLERMHYEDRPYPISRVPFSEVPLIGPLLAGTIGKLIKPPRLMHTDEWMRGDQQLVKEPQFGQTFNLGMGEQLPQKGISPFGYQGIIGEQLDVFKDMIGLPGFAIASTKEKLTGDQVMYSNEVYLQSAAEMSNYERAFYDEEMGNIFGLGEAYRRLYPRRRRLDEYNPIPNSFAALDWLPGAGERGPNLKVGDPYIAVPQGELRLPGKGYEARFSELKGVDPADYPLIHKYRILADVAPYTESFDRINQQVSAARNKKEEWGEYEENLYQVTKEQLANRRIKKEFAEYKQLSPMGTFGSSTFYSGKNDSTGVLTALNEMKAAAKEKEKGGVFTRLFGGYWEALAHNSETAFDQLTPMSPAAKLVHMRTAVEDYERLNLYGSQSAFWQHPIRDFIKPFSNLFASGLGFKGIPEEAQTKRELEEYFDVLKYVKSGRLANKAQIEGNIETFKEAEALKDETLFGVNPFTRDYTSIYRALPASSRDYYQAFTESETTEERARIMEIVPENEKALYVARWKQKYIEDVNKAKKAGLLSEQQTEEADSKIREIYDEARVEGMPTSKDLWAEYIETRLKGESYADWYRRVKLLPKYNIPGSDWVGWHPQIDLEDIKLKVVQNMGEDIHRFNLWQDRERAVLRKPFINEEAIAPILERQELPDEDIRGRINELFLINQMAPSISSTSSYGKGRDTINIQVTQEYEDGLIEAMKELD